MFLFNNIFMKKTLIYTEIIGNFYLYLLGTFYIHIDHMYKISLKILNN